SLRAAIGVEKCGAGVAGIAAGAAAAAAGKAGVQINGSRSGVIAVFPCGREAGGRITCAGRSYWRRIGDLGIEVDTIALAAVEAIIAAELLCHVRQIVP